MHQIHHVKSFKCIKTEFDRTELTKISKYWKSSDFIRIYIKAIFISWKFEKNRQKLKIRLRSAEFFEPNRIPSAQYKFESFAVIKNIIDKILLEKILKYC